MGEMKRNTGVTGLVQFGWLKSGPRENFLGAPTYEVGAPTYYLGAPR